MKIKGNFIRNPLSPIFGGGDIAIRILRVLTMSDEAMNPFQLAKRIGSSDPGVRKSLAALEVTGILVVEIEPSTGYRINKEHHLYLPMFALFAAESKSHSNFDEKIRLAVKAIKNIDSVWIDAKVKSENFKDDEPVIVNLMFRAEPSREVIDSLNDELETIARAYNITLKSRNVSKADLNLMMVTDGENLSEAWLIRGMPPIALVDLPAHFQSKASYLKKSQKEHDEFNLQLGMRVADHIRRDRKILEEALKIIYKKLENVSPSTESELKRWRVLLESRSLKRILWVLTSESEDANRMRQSSPFTALFDKSKVERAK